MAYIQILAIVLCACILQDAYAEKQVVKKSSSKRTTAVAKLANSESPTLGFSKKYPNLSKVQTNFWQAWNYINKKNQYGKLGTRSARNMFEHMVNNESLWGALVKAISRYNKVTHNEEKANDHVKLSNILGQLMTLPIAKINGVPRFTIATIDMYESLVQLESENCEATLLNAANIVNGNFLGGFLNKALNFVVNVDLDPPKIGIFANNLHKLLDLGGMMKMGNIFSSGVLKLAEAVTDEKPERPKLKRQTSKRHK